MPTAERLQKVLSGAGVASRRASEALITAGRVSVNGAVVTALGTRADPERDDIRLDGRRVAEPARRRYLLANKPRRVMTTRSDPEGRRTVLDLVSASAPKLREYIYPVGRLDYDSEGVLLLTNDGELAARLTHPRHTLERIYEAVVRGVPSAKTLGRLGSGIMLDGRRTAPAEVELLGGHRMRREDQARIRVTLVEGRNRQIRRMFEMVGHPVLRLRRTTLGPLSIRGLQAGQTRELTARELTALQHAVGLPTTGPTVRPQARPHVRPSSRPKSRPEGHPSSRPKSRPEGHPSSRPKSRPVGQSARRPPRGRS